MPNFEVKERNPSTVVASIFNAVVASQVARREAR